MFSPNARKALEFYLGDLAPNDRKQPFTKLGWKEVATLAEAFEAGTLGDMLEKELLYRISQ